MDIVDVEEKLNSRLMIHFKGEKDGYVQVGEKKWFYPQKFREVYHQLQSFEVRSDDIWIMGYPRSGTTLTEEIVWLITHNLHFKQAESIGINLRVSFFEVIMLLNEKLAEELVSKFPSEMAFFQRIRDNLKKLKEEKGKRVIKTHLPFELLPEDILNKGCKVIYVCRYPKDVSVSYFFLQSSSRHIGYSGDFENYWQFFRNGHCLFGPYFEHVKQGFDKIGSRNFMFVFFEDFQKDKKAYIKKLAEFLECPISEEEVEKLEKHMNFDHFRKVMKSPLKNDNDEPVNFIRQGKTGEGSIYFTEKISTEANEWIEENTKRIGITFPQQLEH